MSIRIAGKRVEDNPLLHIQRVLSAADKLLTERFGVINPEQAEALHIIQRSAQQFELLMRYADDTASANARRFLSYETRETLTSVLGYSEMLADSAYGSLNADQMQQVFTLRASGKMLLVWLDDLLAAR
jgi:hypothetical protein